MFKLFLNNNNYSYTYGNVSFSYTDVPGKQRVVDLVKLTFNNDSTLFIVTVNSKLRASDGQ